MTAMEYINLLMPEGIVTIFALVLLIFGAICGNRVTRGVDLLATFGLLLAAIFLVGNQHTHNDFGTPATYAFNNMFVDDGFARFVKLLMLIASMMSITMASLHNWKQNEERFEYSVLILFATLGMMLMVSADSMISLYVGLELQSLALYVLAAIRRDDARSSEAGLKYFVLGALSSGLLLYGISLLYGFAGTLDFVELSTRLQGAAVPLGVVFGLVFICAALAFKISAVPFHMWTPDVYEGAPTPVTAFFASAPKIAALALFTRVLLLPLGGLAHQWGQIIVFVAIASMILGSFAGLMQSNLKRLLAYSAIANVGYALVGLACVSKPGVAALLIYLAIYFLNTLGAFAVVLCLKRRGRMVEQISDLSGLARTNPLVALAMVIFMFSLAGVPPMAGFFGKYFIFLAAVNAHMVPLAVIGVLTSVIAAYYYIRIVKVMYFDEPGQPLDSIPGIGVPTVLTITSVCMILFTIWPAPIVDSATAAARSLVGG
jgi:NADH-quinone oxidoreductase subunit N